MASLELRIMIKHFVKEGLKAAEIKLRLDELYRDLSPTRNTLYYWIRQIKMGRLDFHNEVYAGREISVSTPEMVKKVQQIVLGDRRLKLSEIATQVYASRSSIYKILRHDLNMRKISARWVPKLLSAEQMRYRVQCAQSFLDRCGEEPDSVFRQIVTGDETMVLYFDPLTKRDSMEWRCPHEPLPIKARVQQSRRKIMATIFWDYAGILMVDFKEEGTTVNGEHYACLLRRLGSAIAEKRPGKLRRRVLLIHDNAPVHTAAVAKAAVASCGFEEIPHPPYSPDMAPSDYYLFWDLKKELRGLRFSTDNEVFDAVLGFFDKKTSEYYYSGIAELYKRSEKCIRIKGSYVEK